MNLTPDLQELKIIPRPPEEYKRNSSTSRRSTSSTVSRYSSKKRSKKIWRYSCVAIVSMLVLGGLAAAFAAVAGASGAAVLKANDSDHDYDATTAAKTGALGGIFIGGLSGLIGGPILFYKLKQLKNSFPIPNEGESLLGECTCISWLKFIVTSISYFLTNLLTGLTGYGILLLAHPNDETEKMDLFETIYSFSVGSIFVLIGIAILSCCIGTPIILALLHSLSQIEDSDDSKFDINKTTKLITGNPLAQYTKNNAGKIIGAAPSSSFGEILDTSNISDWTPEELNNSV